MKKLFTAVAIFAASLVAQAQTSQGSVMAGGGLSFSSSRVKVGNNESDAYNTFSFSPRVGYFLADRFALGAQLGINTANRIDFDGDDYEGSTRTISIGPFARYYMPTGNDNFSFYLHGGLNFGSTRYNSDNNTLDDMFDDVRNTTLNFGVAPGFTFFPSEKIGLDLQLQGLQFEQYTRRTDDEDDSKIVRSSFVLGVESLSPSIGIHLFF